jgi:hypothetical protein
MIIARFEFTNPEGRKLDMNVAENRGVYSFNRTGAVTARYYNRQEALLEFFRFVASICATVDDVAQGRPVF